MIAFLRGRLAATVANRDAAAIVDVHGVGYRVLVPASAVMRLPSVGSEVELHTSLQVREDSWTLYGFPTSQARDLFEVLLTASGVGPRLALMALSTHTPDALLRAISDGDVDLLTTIPGVGKKSAQRIVLELRERVGGELDEPVVTLGNGSAVTTVDEVRLALVGLGYSSTEAARALAEADRDAPVEQLLRDALRTLAAAGGRGVSA